MRLKEQLTILPAILLMIPCAFGQEIHYNYARGTNFAAYKTYQWVEIPSAAANAAPQNAAAQNTDAPAAAPKLDLPGAPSNLPSPPPSFPSAPPAFAGGAPNFPGAPSDIRSTGSEDQLIDQEIKRAVDEQLAQKGLTKVEKGGDIQVVYHAATHEEVNINLFGSGWGGRGYGGMWDGSVQGQTSSISIGTLVIDVYDPAKRQLIWRGDATKTIDLKKDPDKNYKTLQNAMAKLFKNYPPQPNK